MTRKIILAASLAISLTLSAQKVDVKKDNILVDGTPVAKIQKEKGVYKIFDLKGNYLFSGDVVNRTLGNHPGDNALWLRFTGANGNLHEIDITDKGFTLSNEKILTRNLVTGPTAFLTASGINTEMVNRFFASPDTKLSDETDAKYKAIEDLQKLEDAKAKDAGLAISDKGAILIKNNKVGGIFIKENPAQQMPGIVGTAVVNVTDANGIVIAKIELPSETVDKRMSFLKSKPLKTFDGKILEIHSPFSSVPMNNNNFAKRIVNSLYYNGYAFGDMKNAVEQGLANMRKAANDSYNQAYKDAETHSLNLLETEGYITDKAGNKINGQVSIPFESIDGKLHPNSGISDVTNFGGFVSVKNADGKTKNYRAKDGYTVFAGNRTFIPAQGANDDALGNSSGSQLSLLGEFQYFEKDYENKAGYIVHHVKHPEYFYIKLKNTEVASYLGDKGMFKNKSAEKMEKIFSTTLKCPAMKLADYDTNTKEGMIKVLDDYAAKCK